jgi:hypothetical protein
LREVDSGHLDRTPQRRQRCPVCATTVGPRDQSNDVESGDDASDTAPDTALDDSAVLPS